MVLAQIGMNSGPAAQLVMLEKRLESVNQDLEAIREDNLVCARARACVCV